jgi:TPR repeat protein
MSRRSDGTRRPLNWVGTEVFRLHRKAADLKDTNGMNNLGLMYDDGRGVEQDREKAIEWYRKAVKAGSKDAQGNIYRVLNSHSSPKLHDYKKYERYTDSWGSSR